MVMLAFFFLLRPGKYTTMSSDSTPFRLVDLCLAIGGNYVDIWTAPVTTLGAATFVSLTFITQNNAVRGEVIAIGRSGDPYLCPVLAVLCHVLGVYFVKGQ